MKKIPSLFARNYDTDRLVRDELVPGTEWVAAGEGVATRKFDGTCCLVRDGKLFKRYTRHQSRPAPDGFEPVTEVDPVTGKQEGWLPVGDGPEDAYHREAFLGEPDGTYELCGPKVQGNPEGFKGHILHAHGVTHLSDCPRDFDGIKAYLATHDIEGIVWWHPDGRKAKIKAKDFGLKRGANPSLPRP